jgi:hypothetical protein
MLLPHSKQQRHAKIDANLIGNNSIAARAQ